MGDCRAQYLFILVVIALEGHPVSAPFAFARIMCSPATDGSRCPPLCAACNIISNRPIFAV
eukprot:CAMPEP_0172569356 /NCGR_PEP_ID=MMETSP1067-20121228/123141_1 /TAXON_ID=265564 ORGANISM="Thalassiosira punctigera, Strain Tpunct2005C2" /NCGR_SAMPLE_ID=MMETSP1067 /ASSEMBLY_ACC=CAM_ASM_000444 /LENGTH=60 /DNA_ID=CAMNT_0013361155 /DNA_START=77 /DNA_END=255 /DNA_ORIENTATION=+